MRRAAACVLDGEVVLIEFEDERRGGEDGGAMNHRGQSVARVVRLDAYREAANAAQFLLGCLHEPKWLQRVSLETRRRARSRTSWSY